MKNDPQSTEWSCLSVIRNAVRHHMSMESTSVSSFCLAHIYILNADIEPHWNGAICYFLILLYINCIVEKISPRLKDFWLNKFADQSIYIEKAAWSATLYIPSYMSMYCLSAVLPSFMKLIASFILCDGTVDRFSGVSKMALHECQKSAINGLMTASLLHIASYISYLYSIYMIFFCIPEKFY